MLVEGRAGWLDGTHSHWVSQAVLLGGGEEEEEAGGGW